MLGVLAAVATQVVAERALPRGTVIEAGMVRGVSGEDVDALIGLELTRPVFAGKPIPAAALMPPALVVRQEAVTVSFRRGGLSVTVPGRAMKSGAAGETVPVLIDGSRRSLRGYVIGPGRVEVAP